LLQFHSIPGIIGAHYPQVQINFHQNDLALVAAIANATAGEIYE
jgi:hypothetical protein